MKVRIGVRFAIFALACALAVSIATIARAPQSVFPKIALARVEIFANVGDLPAEAVRESVARPLENALATVPGLRATRTFADQGKLELELDFDPHSSAQNDLRTVRDIVAREKDRLPVSDVVTLIEGPEAEPVVTYAIRSATLSQAELDRRVERAMGVAFLGTPELGRLAAYAGPRIAYEVRLDPVRLRARRITASDVVADIADANQTHALGTLERGDERFPILFGARVTDARSLQSLALAAPVRAPDARGFPVRLGELGGVRLGEESSGHQASFDGEHAVLLNAFAVPDGDAVTLARALAERLPLLRAELPADARIDIAWDQTQLVVASQRALRIEMCLGAAIALLVIAGSLRDRALTLATAIVLPTALAFTTALVVACGLRLDLMTLGGLAIAIGLIVDETIVVVEAIARELATRGSVQLGVRARRAAIGHAVRKIARPLLASTLANVVVFVPLALLGGVPGFFFRDLAITLALALAVSIVLSLTLGPWLALVLDARPPLASRPGPVERVYVRALRFMARRSALFIATSLALSACAIVSLARMPTDFLPNIDEGQFEIKYALPPGMSLRAADAMATNFERAILRDPAVAHVARLTGIDTNGYLATPPDAGTLRVTLGPKFVRTAFDPIAARMRDEIGNVDPYAALEVHQLLEDQINDLSGAPEPIQLTVYGPSQERLARIAATLADDISSVPGVVDTFDGVTWQARTRHAEPRAGYAASDDAATELAARVGGVTATMAENDGGAIPVVVRVDDRAALATRVRLQAPELRSSVREEDGARIVRVTAGLEGADLSTTIAAIRARIARDVAALPPGYRVELGGAVVAERAAFVEFGTILGIAFVLVFGVLLATFDSFRLPLAIFVAVPLAPLGVALALAVTQTSLNVASFMGMLLLVGIVVRNGILLVDAAKRRFDEGAEPLEAIERAALERLRPIAMTTFAALGALAPLAIGFGAGSEMERPLAIAVLGGIVSSTALTLVVVPLLVLVIFRSRPMRSLGRARAFSGSIGEGEREQCRNDR